MNTKILSKLLLAGAFMFSFSSAFTQGVEKITLQQAVDLALKNNLQIKQAQYQAAISEENLTQSKFEQYPNLNSTTSANRQFGLFFDNQTGRLINTNVDQASGRLSSNVVLFGGGSLMNQIKQNKNLLMSNQSNVDKVKNDLSLSVVTTFLQILNNQDLVKASKQQLELSKQQLEVAQKNFNVGNRTQADLSQAKAQVATNELNLTNAENAYELSLLNLKQLMEIDPQRNIEIVIPAVDNINQLETNYSGYDVYSKAVQNYPDIKLASYNVEAFKYGVNVAKGNLYPTLGFGVGLSTGYSSANPLSFSKQVTDNNFGQFVGFNLSIPIFNNYRNRSQYNIAKIRFENAKATEQLAKNNLNKVINQAVQDLKSAVKSYDATQSAFNSSKDAFNVIKQRYDVGLANSIDLATSQTNFNKAEFDFIQAKYNVIFRSKVIDFYLGKPLTL
ncbi:TolC family protein [Pelobium sp.]|nr:TolC family protein [Pelobium sp.]MDA9555100.1 TolC family protein [Pelobium sp.]